MTPFFSLSVQVYCDTCSNSPTWMGLHVPQSSLMIAGTMPFSRVQAKMTGAFVALHENTTSDDEVVVE